MKGDPVYKHFPFHTFHILKSLNRPFLILHFHDSYPHSCPNNGSTGISDALQQPFKEDRSTKYNIKPFT